MRLRGSATLAIGMALFALAMTILALIFQGLGAEPDVAETLLVSSFAGLGLIVALRVPHNRLGWLFLVMAAINSFASAGGSLVTLARDVWQRPDIAKIAIVASGWEWFAFVGVIGTFALLLFPDGHLPSPRWRWVARASGAAIVVGSLLLIALTVSDLDTAISDAAEETFGPFWLNVAVAAAGVVLVGCVLASVASVAVRWRRAEGVARQQLKWFAFGGIVQTLGIAAGFGDGAVFVFMSEASILSLPVASVLAILRYRLYDIDRLISRTVSYMVLTAALLGLYVGAISLSTAMTSSVSGQSSLAVAAATLLAAAAFQPLRRRIQNAVDHRFNRAQYDAAMTLTAYRGVLRDSIDIEHITSDLQSAVHQTLQPSATTLWLRSPGALS